MRVKFMTVKQGGSYGITHCPNFHKSGSVAGMKKLFYGKNALLVRCGSYIYNVSNRPEIYHYAK